MELSGISNMRISIFQIVVKVYQWIFIFSKYQTIEPFLPRLNIDKIKWESKRSMNLGPPKRKILKSSPLVITLSSEDGNPTKCSLIIQFYKLLVDSQMSFSL